MRHRYECPLRWADLDPFQHINNVKYFDYLQEARAALLRTCLRAVGARRNPDEAYVVVRHEVSFRAPLLLRAPTVSIDSWVSEFRAASFTLTHEIYDEASDGTRTVYLRARTVLSPFLLREGKPRRVDDLERTALGPYLEADEAVDPLRAVRVDLPDAGVVHHPLHIRFSDVDMYRHVNNVKYAEYFQEARIAMVRRHREALRDLPKLSVVLARTEVEYVAPMTLRGDPYDCWTAITGTGTKSMVVDGVITAGTGGDREARTLARSKSVLVFFDVATQRSVTPPAGYLDAMLAVTNPPAAG